MGERLAAWTWEGMSQQGGGWGGPGHMHWPGSDGPVTSAQRLESPPGSCRGVWEGFEWEMDGF